MAFHVGDRVRISFPHGAQWNKKTQTGVVTAKDVQGQVGVVTQHLAQSGQTEYKVLIKEIGEFRFWERDLKAAGEEPVVEAPVYFLPDEVQAKEEVPSEPAEAPVYFTQEKGNVTPAKAAKKDSKPN